MIILRSFLIENLSMPSPVAHSTQASLLIIIYRGILIIPSTYYVVSHFSFHNFSSEYNYVEALKEERKESKNVSPKWDDEDPSRREVQTERREKRKALEKDE